MRSTVTIEDAKARIFAQEVPRNLRRSAVMLFNHLCQSIDPGTGKLYTKARALSNVMRWMSDCELKQARLRRALSPQQKQLVQMLVDGMTQSQIGGELSINLRNLQRRFARIRNRLGVETIYQVVALSVGYGWVDIDHLESNT